MLLFDPFEIIHESDIVSEDVLSRSDLKETKREMVNNGSHVNVNAC